MVSIVTAVTGSIVNFVINLRNRYAKRTVVCSHWALLPYEFGVEWLGHESVLAHKAPCPGSGVSVGVFPRYRVICPWHSSEEALLFLSRFEKRADFVGVPCIYPSRYKPGQRNSRCGQSDGLSPSQFPSTLEVARYNCLQRGRLISGPGRGF